MELSKAIDQRRSYRSLEPVVINEQMVSELAGAARLAPSCYNNQPWRYIFVYDEKVLDQLKEALSRGNEWARHASMIIAVCSKPELDCQIKDGREYYSFGVGMSVGIMMLKATELRLVCHAIAGYSPKKAGEVLNVPEDMEVVTLLIVGKHSDEIKPYLSDKQIEDERSRPERLDLSGFAFRDRYGEGI
ncbi:MAG: nitroreductase [Candidatus Latescibacteria bacterium]|nr:nitroreductase [bacterium]MBD3425516.1 nitroreductase [Candidatus Latescibacterota bacterium]